MKSGFFAPSNIPVFTKDGQTYHVVLDAVGKSSFGIEMHAVWISSPGGYLLSLNSSVVFLAAQTSN